MEQKLRLIKCKCDSFETLSFYEDNFEMQVRIYHRKLPLKKLRLTNEIFLDDFVMAEFTEWNSSFGLAQNLGHAQYLN